MARALLRNYHLPHTLKVFHRGHCPSLHPAHSLSSVLPLRHNLKANLARFLSFSSIAILTMLLQEQLLLYVKMMPFQTFERGRLQ